MIARMRPAIFRAFGLLLAGIGFPQLSAPRACSQPVDEPEVVIVDSADVFLRWHGHGGRTYFIQAADPNGPLLANDPLQRWVWQDAIEFGNDEEISYEAGTTAGKGFFRLHSTDQSPPPGVSLEDWDADGDGLSNGLELQLQTHPLDPDTSGDGILDGWAHAHGLNPLAHNAAGLFQGGGVSNLGAFQAGVQAHPSATLANLDGDSLDNELDADPRERAIDWSLVSPPAFAVLGLNVNDVEELVLDDFTAKGTVLLTRIQNLAPVERIVIDLNRVAHAFPVDYSVNGAPFGSHGRTLVGERVPGTRMVNGSAVDCLWDPLADTFTTWQRPVGYDDDILDARGGVFVARNWLGFGSGGLRHSPNGDLLPGEDSGNSWNARIEVNGNIVSEKGYWQKDFVSGLLSDVMPFPVPSSAVRSATLAQSSSGGGWNLVASHFGLIVAKNGGAFIKANGELAGVPIHGVTQQGWVADTHQDHIRANGVWYPLDRLLDALDCEEADLLDIMDTGQAIAKIRRPNEPLRLAMLVPMQMYSNRASILPKYRGTFLQPYYCNHDEHREEIKGALTIYHKSVRNENGETDDFDVTLNASSLDNVTWTKIAGPDSGELINSNSATAIFRNPKKGGLYEFGLSVGGESILGKLQLWLPVAGPHITSYWEGEIAYFKNVWGPAYRNRLNDRTVLLAWNPPKSWMAKQELAVIDLWRIGNDLDWNGSIFGSETPCGGPVSAIGNRLTLHGFVISWSKRNNMLYALIGREMGLKERVLINAGHLINIASSGTLDSAEAVESYGGGFDLFNGIALENVMKSRGLKMHLPGGWDQWEWPSHEISNEELERKAKLKLQELIQ